MLVSAPILMVLMAVGPACQDDGATRTVDGDLTPELRLVFSLEAPTSRAGEPVGYLAYLDGFTEPYLVQPELISDAQDELYWDDLTLTPTLAQTHNITATVYYDGEEFSAVDTVLVDPNVPDLIDLQLSDLATQAGVPLPYEVFIWDAWDNPIDASMAVLETDSAHAKLIEGNLVSTLPGTYRATATADLVADTEAFTVVAGPAASLTLVLEDEDLERDETTLAYIEVTDTYGNPIAEGWDLWVDPPDGVEIRYNALTFREEGFFTVWAATEDAALSDSVGPLLIDSTGPDLIVTHPERGYRTSDVSDTITGTHFDEYSGTASITVNGEPAIVYEDGTWEAPVDYEFGTNTISTEAWDNDGNPTTDSRAVLSGNWTAYGNGVADGFMVRIFEAGFEAFEAAAGDFLDMDDLLGSIPNPLVSEESEDCWLGVCLTWYSLEVRLVDVSIGELGVSIDPKSGGYLETIATIYDIYIGYDIDATVLYIPFDADGYISADSIDIGMDMTPWVSGGVLGVTVSNVDASATGFDFDWDSWLYDVLEFFGLDLDGLIKDVLMDFIESAAQDEIPDLINDLLSSLQIAESFEIEDNTYHFDAIPSSVSVDDDGLTLGLETGFTTENWVSTSTPSPGSVTYPYTPPIYAASSDMMALAMSQDFLNQLFNALWGGGLLDIVLTSEELGIDLDDFALFMPDLTDLSVKVKPYLPPVVVPGTGGAMLDLQLGDFELTLYNGPPEEAYVYLRVYVHVNAGLEMGTDSGTLTAGLGDMSMSFDLVEPDGRSEYAQDTELFLEALVPMLLPMLTDSLTTIPIPELEGLGLTNISVELEGAENGYVQLSGELDLSALGL
jgi:hypothetical protein